MALVFGKELQDVGHGALVAGLRTEVEGHVAVAELDGFLGYVDGLHEGGTAAEGGEGETAGVAEAV